MPNWNIIEFAIQYLFLICNSKDAPGSASVQVFQGVECETRRKARLYNKDPEKNKILHHLPDVLL